MPEPIVLLLAAPFEEHSVRISEIITQNFAHDPAYRDYPAEVLDTYIATNTPERILHYLQEPESWCFVARQDGTIVGVVLLRYYAQGYPDALSTNAWRIRRLHVAPEVRGQGIAVTLLGVAERFVAGRGYPVIYAEPTPEAAGLCLKLGWTGHYVTKPVTYTGSHHAPRTIDVPRFIAHKRLR